MGYDVWEQAMSDVALVDVVRIFRSQLVYT